DALPICPANRTCRNGRISPESEFAGHKLFGSPLIQYQHHAIGLRPADLKSEASAFHPDRRGSGPACLLLTACEVAAAKIGSYDERSFLHAGHDYYTLGLLQEVLRY